MKIFVKRFLYIALAALCCILLQKFCRSKTDGFALYKIQSHLPYNPEFEVRSVSEKEIHTASHILDQPFYYLGKGAQCYAFVSEDGNYVLKFFRLYHLRPPEWFTSMPLPSFLQGYRQEKIERKFEELSRDFLSYKIAFDELKDDTGLLYVHLNKTDHFHKKVTLYDKIKVKHSIDIDSMEFLLQKKADLFYPAMQTMIDGGKKEEAKAALQKLVSFLAKRASLGLYDKDPDINTNFGIANGSPLQIDVGRFRPDPSRKDPSLYITDIIRVTDNLRQWLEAQDKELSDALLNEIEHLQAEKKVSA